LTRGVYSGKNTKTFKFINIYLAPQCSHHMKQIVKNWVDRLIDHSTRVLTTKNSGGLSFADEIAFRGSLETLLGKSSAGMTPDEIFYGIGDDFWFWLNTVGVRRNSRLSRILPGLPNADIQQNYTGSQGDSTMFNAINSYKIYKQQYEKYKGDLAQADKILDFGCGWGRIIRLFLKDLPPSKIWGCDPVADMITICREQNKWCNFEHIDTNPPTPFQNDSFDMIYSFSVFSHLSEKFHLELLSEIKRILKPGGIYITTTRNRQFFEFCAQLSKRKDFDKLHQATSGSSVAFPNTQKSISEYDQGLYCHHSFASEEWPYWGETAIPKKYVVDQWTRMFTFLDYIENDIQNIIVVQKGI
jgi:SAM-dependent methyltransferase